MRSLIKLMPSRTESNWQYADAITTPLDKWLINWSFVFKDTRLCLSKYTLIFSLVYGIWIFINRRSSVMPIDSRTFWPLLDKARDTGLSGRGYFAVKSICFFNRKLCFTNAFRGKSGANIKAVCVHCVPRICLMLKTWWTEISMLTKLNSIAIMESGNTGVKIQIVIR